MSPSTLSVTVLRSRAIANYSLICVYDTARTVRIRAELKSGRVGNNDYHKLEISANWACRIGRLNARLMLISYHGPLLNRALG